MEAKLTKLIQSQINWELYSAYAYYYIAEYYRSKGLNGFHTYFEKHAGEERQHAEKFSEYLQDHDIPVKLESINVLDKKFASLRDPLVFFVEHEKEVTSLIHQIYRAAREQDDIETRNFLTFFITEQSEEEKTATDLLTNYDLFAKEGGIGLYQRDKDLAK